jgi:mannose-1-phosphate guanylyltransferase
MFAVIMAGGSGTRFWPASRQHLPKQFLKITGARTMVEETVDRALRVTDEDRVYLVINRMHEEITWGLFPNAQVKVLVEPAGRNTAACIGLAAIHLKYVDPGQSLDEPMVVLPADHFIADPEKFRISLQAAVEIAASGGIVTIGALPTRPETGYGYIKTGRSVGQAAGQPYFAVDRFAEKPDFETAVSFVSSGGYLWNCGIFAFTPRTILDEIQACQPRLFEGLCRLEEALETDRYQATLDEVYPQLESISIDYGVLEKTSAPLYVVPSDFGWSDVGSWQSLYELRAGGGGDELQNLVLGDAVLVDAKRNLVFSDRGRLVALLGVEELVIVDTDDALLVADINRSQDVKQLIELLREQGRDGIC